MNQAELLKEFDAIVAKMRHTIESKNTDYASPTAASVDAFANFTRVEALGIASTEQGFLTRMTDKFCRIASFVRAGTLAVKTESVLDTVEDLACYAILLFIYLKSKLELARNVQGR